MTRTEVADFTSSVNGRRYRMMVGLPLLPPPPQGYHVVYVLDGDFYFASVLEAARASAPSTVVVGIGYPVDDEAWARSALAKHGPAPPLPPSFPAGVLAAAIERSYDLTLPASDAALAAQQFPGAPVQHAGEVGGADDLLRTIERDVKPRVAAVTKIDPQQQTLFGYSLGGLTVLHALFTEPSAFRSFIIASPSIWWSDRAVLADERGFAAAVTQHRATPRVLVTVGSDEDNLPLPPPGAKGSDILSRVHMVQSARDLAIRLKGLAGVAPYQVEFALFDRQAHGISFWPAVGRAMPFVAAP